MKLPSHHFLVKFKEYSQWRCPKFRCSKGLYIEHHLLPTINKEDVFVYAPSVLIDSFYCDFKLLQMTLFYLMLLTHALFDS